MPLLTGHVLLLVVVVVGCSFSAWRFLACKLTIKLQDGKTDSVEAGRSLRP
jgi:hypothetical protein